MFGYTKLMQAMSGVAAVVSTVPFNLVTLLLNTTATNGAQNNTFLDSSTNNFSITRNGNTTQGTFTPFSQTGWGAFNVGTASYCQLDNSDYSISTGDFTVEFWMFVTSDKAATCFCSATTNTNLTVAMNGGSAGARQPYIEYGGSGTSFTAFSNYLNTWTHVAFVRSSGTVTVYQNGVALSSTSKSAAVGTTANLYLLRNAGDANQDFPGYISNFRICKAAVYTGTFTPSTTNLTTASQGATSCQLLTFQNNRFLDNSSNASTVTPTLTQVQAFNPFLPTTAYSTSVVGGSGYFDGSDYLNFTDSSNVLDMGGAVTSVEGFFYPTSTSSAQCLIAKGGGSGSWSTGSGFEWQVTYSSGKFDFSFNNAGSPATISTSAVPLNQWYHVAVATDASSNISLYLNGVRVATATNAITKPTSRTLMYLGQDVSASYFTGYMSGVRFISGSGAYNPTSTTITVPTAPPTAITNTQLLTNFTNAGIYDSAAKNDLETVGDAQVSTTQAKFGTTSMYFDGTGDYLIGKSTDFLSFGSGDFTIEMWVYPASIPASDKVLVDTRSIGSDSGYAAYINGGTLKIYSSAADIITSTSNIVATTWSHIAFVRASGVLAIYINGSQSGTATYTGSMTCPGRITIAAGSDNAANYNGYIDELRVTKGYAVYTANFTPPTAAFPVQ